MGAATAATEATDVIAAAWCVGFAAVSYPWAKRTFDKA